MTWTLRTTPTTRERMSLTRPRTPGCRTALPKQMKMRLKRKRSLQRRPSTFKCIRTSNRLWRRNWWWVRGGDSVFSICTRSYWHYSNITGWTGRWLEVLKMPTMEEEGLVGSFRLNSCTHTHIQSSEWHTEASHESLRTRDALYSIKCWALCGC